jgi:ATP/maltotriose-dependent transcriptional regulator MalT
MALRVVTVVITEDSVKRAAADTGSRHMPYSASIAKISRPSVSGAVRRARLFEMLDNLRGTPVVWIAAPGGYGKTTLAASWLGTGKLHALWYRIDEGDSNLEAFFYYLGLAALKAAPRRKGSLPLLTSEFLPGINTFVRRYFESLFDRIRSSPIMLLDNYQEIPEDSPFHAILAGGLDAIPPGAQVIVLSRREPPSEFARLIANGRIQCLHGQDLRFTLEEFGELATMKGIDCSDGGMMLRIYERTGGWAAAVTLLIERRKREGKHDSAFDRVGGESLFSYFTGEIFGALEPGVQDFLLKTSFLPSVSPGVAESLTGHAGAGRLLSDMSRNSFFTDRHSESEYRYHPLFREYLQKKAEKAYTAEELAKLRARAAQILEQAGRIDDAAALYCAAESWDELLALTGKVIEGYLATGRSGVVEKWLSLIPKEHRDRNPWSLYWLGLCLQGRNPSASCALYERAFAIFEKNDDMEGAYLCWARLTEAVVNAWTDSRVLDRWIAWLDDRIGKGCPFPSEKAEADVAVSMIYILTHRRFDHPDINLWADRALSMTLSGPGRALRIKALIYTSQYYTFMGDRERIMPVLNEMRILNRRMGCQPLLSIQCALMEAAAHCWEDMSFEGVIGCAEEGISCAEKHDIHIFDHLLYQMCAAASLSKADLEHAALYLQKMACSIGTQFHALCHFDHLSTWYQFLRGDLGRALVHAESSLGKTLDSGMYYSEIISRHLMAQVLNRMGRHDEAEIHLLRLNDLALASRSPNFIFTTMLTQAQFALERGDLEQSASLLARAFRTGCEHSLFVPYYWWDPVAMNRLCSMALDRGIEVEYVNRLITLRGLKPEPKAPVPPK